MTFEVGFSLQVDTVFVAEIIEIGVIGVVRCAHVVDIGTLHHHHFLFHLLVCDGVTAFRVRLMSVDALQFQRLAVHEEVASCQSKLIVFSTDVLNLHSSEANLCRNGLLRASLLVLQFGHQHVYLWFFSRPWLQSEPFCGDSGGLLRLECCHEAVVVTVELILIKLIFQRVVGILTR